jgi:Lon protease-like protein
MNRIGLFPLGIVIFPESSFPLHIFEERYKQLINDCYEEDKPFGINLVSKNNLNDIGCKVIVDKVIKTYPDGKQDVIIKGIERFRLINFSEGEKPYFIGEVEEYADIEEELDNELLFECADLFNNIVTNISTVMIEKVYPAQITTKTPSFLIAQKSGLTIKQRQTLLEEQSENNRLEIIIKHLKTLLPVVKETELVTKIIKNDGYFPPTFK